MAGILACGPVQPGISVVIPVRDDAEGIIALFDALAAQTRPPDEVIIVDDGSTDGTRAVLEDLPRKAFAYRAVDAGGVGIAAARNLGISLANHEWIACTDAGCIPVPEWLEAIDEARGNADFLAGVVIVDACTLTQRLLALSAFPRLDELGSPSVAVRASHRLFGRGTSSDRVGGGYMAFRRAVWEAVGGFPPGLRSSDDHGFARAVANAQFRMARARGAAVHWRPRDSLLANLAMFFNYSRGDVRIRPRRRHAIRTGAYVCALRAVSRGDAWERAGLAAAGLAYMWLPLHRALMDRLPLRHWWRIPIVIVLKDLSQVGGALVGVLDAVTSRSR